MEKNKRLSLSSIRSQQVQQLSDQEKLLRTIEESQLGCDTTLQGPYGTKRVLYADYTASGKPLSFIEDYLRDEVASCYGNTHTTTSYTSRQTTLYREEARFIIRNALHCTERDALIFTGSGCTGAIHKLVHCLQLEDLDPHAVVFVSTFEHHSNLLPWKETKGTEVIRVPETMYGELDLKFLEEKLKHYKGGSHKLIGAFNAASNITGVLTDTDAVSSLVHHYGGLVFWDYATAAPYVKIDMNPSTSELAYKDGVYFSMHKFVGGPDSPGILAVKRNVLQNATPHVPGGGTVLFVTKENHRYHQDAEVREEGGTPAILGSIRAGLAVQLKEAVGTDYIMAREERLCRRAFMEWESVSELKLVGPHSIPRLPIFSFLVHHPASGLYLHHYFVCALLNDLFGIQARGGCACAGPYGQTLLDIPEEVAMKYVLEDSKQRDSDHSERELLKPGMTRLNFTYFMSDEAVDYIIKAVAMVAKHGWKLLPQYTVNPETGLFSHKDYSQNKRCLSSITYKNGHMIYEKTTYQPAASFEKQLQFARRLFDEAIVTNEQLSFDHLPLLSKDVEENRWFLMPDEAHHYLMEQSATPLTHFQLKIKEYLPKSSPLTNQRQVSIKRRKSSLKLLADLKPSSLTKRSSRDRLFRIEPSVESPKLESAIVTTPGASRARLLHIMSFTLTTVEEPTPSTSTTTTPAATVVTSTISVAPKRWQSTDCLQFNELDEGIEMLSESDDDQEVSSPIGMNQEQVGVVNEKVSKRRHKFLKLLKRLF